MGGQPNYLNASAINDTTYDQLLFIASNELDWPQQSGSTGFLKEANKDCPGQWRPPTRGTPAFVRLCGGATSVLPACATGPIDSIYLRMRERNRCNHRDFQNIGVNGARVGSMVGRDELGKNRRTGRTRKNRRTGAGAALVP